MAEARMGSRMGYRYYLFADLAVERHGYDFKVFTGWKVEIVWGMAVVCSPSRGWPLYSTLLAL